LYLTFTCVEGVAQSYQRAIGVLHYHMSAVGGIAFEQYAIRAPFPRTPAVASGSMGSSGFLFGLGFAGGAFALPAQG